MYGKSNMNTLDLSIGGIIPAQISYISALEACHANKADMDFTWTWPMDRVLTYRTRIAAGIVVHKLTEHERKLRRLHAHLGDDVAMSEDQEMGDHFTNVDPSACKVKWQVAYKSSKVLNIGTTLNSLN